MRIIVYKRKDGGVSTVHPVNDESLVNQYGEYDYDKLVAKFSAEHDKVLAGKSDKHPEHHKALLDLVIKSRDEKGTTLISQNLQDFKLGLLRSTMPTDMEICFECEDTDIQADITKRDAWTILPGTTNVTVDESKAKMQALKVINAQILAQTKILQDQLTLGDDTSKTLALLDNLKADKLKLNN